MNLLTQAYIKGLAKTPNSTLNCFSIFYKALYSFNYNLFFFFKLVLIKSACYRLYLLNTNFYSIFVDYIYTINYIKHLNNSNLVLSFLPLKVKTYSVLRSPFVYSKSREQYSVNYYSLFFCIQIWKLSELYFWFLEHLITKIQLEHSKIWSRFIIGL